MVGQDAALEILRARCLSLDLGFQPLGHPGHAGEGEVVLRHLIAELLARSFHQRLGIARLDAADEQSQKAAEQPADS